MKEELLSELPTAHNWIFILFLFCFFACTQLLANKRELFFVMLNDLYRTKDRQSIFYEIVGNEVICKILVSIQTIILLSIISYCVLLHSFDLEFETLIQLFRQLGSIILIVTAYISYKFLISAIVGYIFFSDKDAKIWNNLSFTILSLCGLGLFVPALLMYYLENTYYLCFYVSLIYLLFVIFFTSYKSYMIFFHDKNVPYYFILYLCVCELSPLYLSYKAIVYCVNI